MSYSQHPQGANCRKLQLFARGLLFSSFLSWGVSAGRHKVGRKPGVPFRVKPQVFVCTRSLSLRN